VFESIVVYLINLSSALFPNLMKSQLVTEFTFVSFSSSSSSSSMSTNSC